MFNDKPKFIDSSDIIDIINAYPTGNKEVKKPIIIKKEVQAIPEPIVEKIVESQEIKVDKKIENPVRENYRFRYAGDDIPWLY